MKRNISFLLALLMCCSLLFPGIQTTAMAQDVPENSAKIAAELLEKMENAADDALIHIAIDLVSPSDAEIKAHIAATSADTINTYIMAKRAAQREVISGMTTAFAENYLDDGDEITFRGNYSPSIWVKVPKFKIALLAALDEVKSIGFAGYDNVQWLPQAEQVDSDHISEYLLEKMKLAADDELIHIVIDLTSPSIAELEARVSVPVPADGASATEVDAYRTARLAVIHKAISGITDAFVQSYLNEGEEITYQGQYTASVWAKVAKSKIASLAMLDEVTSLDLIDDEPVVPEGPDYVLYNTQKVLDWARQVLLDAGYSESDIAQAGKTPARQADYDLDELAKIIEDMGDAQAALDMARQLLLDADVEPPAVQEPKLVDYNKISAKLLEKMETLPDGERIAVAIEREGLDEDMIRQQTCLECGVSEGIARILDEGFRTLDEYNASHPYADIYSEAKMNVLASLYGEYNRAFLAALLPDLSEDCLCYVSDHSPSIHAMLTKAEILHLTTSKQVKSLTVSKGVYTEEPIISAKLAARMETATDTQRIAVAISRKGIDREILLPLIAQESGLSPETIEKVNNSLATVEEAMTYKAARLAVEKRLYAEYNSAFLAECLPDLPSGCLSYVADTYSTIHASLTKAEILSLVDVDQVISMDYVGPEFEDEDPLKAFRDLPAPTSWKYEGIVYCIDNRIMNGVSATKFEPDSELTRGQLVTVLYRVNGEPEVAFTKAFSDVPSGKYYSAAVAWAAKHDIVNGFEDGTFCPDAPVTREQLVTILYRYTHYLGIEIAGNPEVLSDFPDAAQVSSYAEDAFGWAVAEKLVNGVDVQGESFLKPKNHATRAQIASILMRYLEATEIPEPIINDSGTVNLMSSVSAKLVDQPDRINSKSADAVADFSLSFFRTARNADSNTVLSPLSVLYALALLQNGAQGQTLQELEAATGMSTQQLNEALRAIMGNLQEAYGNTEISIANSIWVRNGFGVKQPFLQNNADYLDAAAYSTPMDDTSVKEMNDWISENTNGMIENLISELPAEMVLALINAIAFKGEWTHPYESVAPGIFHAADGTEQEVEMLRSLESVYLHDDKVQGFAKHFYSDRYAFAVILPNEGIALEDYLEDLDGAALRKLLSEASNASVMTTMPKFKAETTVKLPAPLAKLGIRSAFSPFTSNLSGISDTPLFVSDGIQKAVIDVNKDGVSAAAATALLVEATSAPDEPIATITVDRPYLYLIYDSMTNVPLFVGTNVSFNN